MKLKDGLALLREYVNEVEPNESFMQQLAAKVYEYQQMRYTDDVFQITRDQANRVKKHCKKSNVLTLDKGKRLNPSICW